MKKINIIGLLLLVLIFSNCMSPKRVQRNLDKWCELCEPESIEKDSVYIENTVIEYRDTIIYLTVYKDTTITVVKKVYIENGQAYLNDTVKVKGKYSDAVAWIENNLMHLALNEHDSLFVLKIQNAVKDTKTEVQIETSEKEIIKVKYIPKWVWYLLGLNILGVIILAIRFIIKIYLKR